jgi:FAD dependent oxidoreductase TIGR03364
MRSSTADLIVIGAGIVGLAHALAAARRGKRVILVERHEHAVGASVRNFGLVWPIGQPDGARHERALRSREIWGEVAEQANLHLADTGSLHLAYHDDEWALLKEFAATRVGSMHGRDLLSPRETSLRSATVNPSGLRGALWSPTEATVDPRQAIRHLPAWLRDVHGVELRFGTTVSRIELPRIETTTGTLFAEHAIVCSGPDFETLYPAVFAAAPLTRCKLQMLRTVPQPIDWALGPALCAGLTLTHYDSFKSCPGLAALRTRVQAEFPFHTANGIHVLLSETAQRELTIGDSHHYGLTPEPFDRDDVNAAILSYLATFAIAPTLAIAERWHGIYPKLTDGGSEFVATPEPGVTIVNGLGGAGMTLSFGLAEEIVGRLY